MKEASIASLARYQTVLGSLDHNLETNLTFDDLMWIRAKAGHASRHIESQTLQGEPATINGIDYQIAPTATINHVSQNLRRSLDLPISSFQTDALNPLGATGN